MVSENLCSQALHASHAGRLIWPLEEYVVWARREPWKNWIGRVANWWRRMKANLAAVRHALQAATQGRHSAMLEGSVGMPQLTMRVHDEKHMETQNHFTFLFHCGPDVRTPKAPSILLRNPHGQTAQALKSPPKSIPLYIRMLACSTLKCNKQ